MRVIMEMLFNHGLLRQSMQLSCLLTRGRPDNVRCILHFHLRFIDGTFSLSVVSLHVHVVSRMRMRFLNIDIKWDRLSRFECNLGILFELHEKVLVPRTAEVELSKDIVPSSLIDGELGSEHNMEEHKDEAKEDRD